MVVQSHVDDTFKDPGYGLSEDDNSEVVRVDVGRFAWLQKDDPVCSFEGECVSACLKR